MTATVIKCTITSQFILIHNKMISKCFANICVHQNVNSYGECQIKYELDAYFLSFQRNI